MKKKIFLLASLMALLTGCKTSISYIPRHGGLYTKPETVEEEPEVLMCTYNFFASYNNCTVFNQLTHKNDLTPIFSGTYEMMKPIGACPEEVNSQAKVIALAETYGFTLDLVTFPKFIGFSTTGVAIEDENLFNFAEDYVQAAVVNLYGVWVSEA